jgi:N-glycosylase/DNA lyase
VKTAAPIGRSAQTNALWWAPVWARHSPQYTDAAATTPAGEADLRKELIFCLLGGHGVTFELAMSATAIVLAICPFGSSRTPLTLREALHRELEKPQFEPRRQDGSLRRYRFPNRKAELLAEAVDWVHAQGGLRPGLEALSDEGDRRAWLCECPGVGMKTASWVLRNCGWARNVAILDVHLLRALDEAGVARGTTLPRDYLAIEGAYLRWAEELEACPAALDLFLWDVQRSLRPAAAAAG